MAKSSDISLFRIFVSVFCILLLAPIFVIARTVWGYIPDIGLQSNTPDTLIATAVFPWRSLNQWVLWVHVTTALPPLLIGMFGFVRPVIQSSLLRPLHRWLGTVYVFTIFASAITGFVLAMGNEHGWMAQSGFGMLAIAWFSTTWMAWIKARRKNFIQHREWMIRSYMITLAVLSVRLLPTPAGFTFAEWYPWLTWLCWVPNLILAEVYVRVTTFKGVLRRPGQKRPRGRDRLPT
jgi:uncharacterized membrane protein